MTEEGFEQMKTEVKALDDQYSELDAVEEELQDMLYRLQHEELVLKEALSLASETLQERRAREKKKTEEEIEKRLAESLFADSSSSSDSE